MTRITLNETANQRFGITIGGINYVITLKLSAGILYASVSIDSETLEKLRTVAKLSGKSQNGIISEIITPLARLLTSFDPREKPLGFWVDVTTEPPKIQLTVTEERGFWQSLPRKKWK